MAKIVRTERRRRGLFGKLFALLFWAWHALMLVWLVAAVFAMAEQGQQFTSDAEKAGAAIGAGIGLSLLLGVWMAGAVITGLLSWATRGPLIVTEETRD